MENSFLSHIHDEQVRVEILNSVILQMKEDLLDKDKCQPFLEMSKDENPNNDFERGVYAAIALLKFRVHCICD